MTRPLKIAFIGGRGVAGTYSGIETYYEEVGAHLVQRGHQVVAYCRNYFTAPTPTYRGITVRRLPSLRTKHLDTLVHTFLSTVDALPRGFDVIHYHALGPTLFAILPRFFGRTTIGSVHGLDWQRAKWGRVARTVLRACEWTSSRCPSATVVVSRTLQQHYTASHGRVPHCIPNGVTPIVPRPPQRIKQYGLTRDEFLLFAGRLSPEKGVHTLLDALRSLPRRMPLVLAGGDSYSGDYIDALRAAAWEQVRFLGNVDRETLEELYSNCCAFVLPSAMEGLSVALLEALSAGACIVTTNIPENLEVIGDAGLTFSPGDADALREHLRALVDDPERRRAYRQRAQAHARTLARWDDVARATEQFYYQLLGSAPEPLGVGAIVGERK